MGSGCGTVGRSVASDTRNLQFGSRHRPNFIYQLYNRKDENKEKEAGNGPSSKKRNQAVKSIGCWFNVNVFEAFKVIFIVMIIGTKSKLLKGI